MLITYGDDGPEESLLKYTQEWVKKIDRGGLFEVSDGCYHLFAAIEIAQQSKGALVNLYYTVYFG